MLLQYLPGGEVQIPHSASVATWRRQTSHYCSPRGLHCSHGGGTHPLVQTEVQLPSRTSPTGPRDRGGASLGQVSVEPGTPTQPLLWGCRLGLQHWMGSVSRIGWLLSKSLLSCLSPLSSSFDRREQGFRGAF